MDERSTRTDSGDAGLRSTALPSEPGPPPDEPDPLVGSELDRYRVEARRGAGGQGMVYTAYDPALDRRIALKVLPAIEDERRAHFEQRLRREAQALARLAHPNVVAVYDVGVAEHSVFIAMQLVDGVNVDEWLEAASRSPREIIEMLVAAGRGLAAAHDAGIVHRDVKPSNVLVDAKGGVCVGDFGLARSAEEAEPSADDASLLDVNLTRAGAVVGTLPFMAPEQHRGEPATPRSDQFSFCVMAWKALFGQHPFVAGPWDTAKARAAMAADAIIEPPRRMAIARALRRGLRHDPAERWPSMHALVEAIRPRSYAAWWWGAGTLVVGMALAATVASYLTPAAAAQGCAAARPAWGTFARLPVQAAVAASGRPGLFAHLAHALDERTSAWSEAHDAACKARDDQAGELFARRMLCLDRRNAETRALIEQLSRPQDGETLDKAVGAVGSLGAIADCQDSDALLGLKPHPHSEHAMDVDQRLARADALDTLGKYKEELAIVQPIIGEARTLGYGAAAAEALHLQARALDGLAQYKEAETAAYDAITEAGRAGDDVLAARAMLLQVYITNDDEGKPDIAMALARAAEGMVARTHRPELAASLEMYRGSILYGQGKLAEALNEYESALAKYLAMPAQRLSLARTYNNMSLVEGDAGRLHESLDHAREALAIYEAELGREHPDSLTIRVNIAMGEQRLGMIDQARTDYHDVIAAIERTFGPEHGQLAAPLSNLASLEADAGNLEVSLPLAQRANAIVEKAFGPDNPRMAWTLDNVAENLRRLGRLDEAEATERKALAVGQKAFGADNADLAYELDNLGKILRDRGRLAEARASIESGLALRTKVLGSDNEAVGWSLGSRASVLQAQGDCAGALVDAKHAVAILEAKLGKDHHDLAAPRAVIAACSAKK